MAYLVVFREGAEILRLALDRSETVVGRGEDAHLLLADEGISRRHAVIRGEQGEWTLENLSRNGTVVDGKPVDTAPLKDGARLELGPFKVVFTSAAPVSPDATRTVTRDPTRVLAVEGDGRRIVVERAALEIADGPDKGKRFDVRHERVLVGKAPGCDVELTDTYVSAQHFRIEHGSTGFRMRDMGSTNGTLVNGMRVADAVLPFGAEIRVGKTVLRFVSRREERSIAPSGQSSFEGMVGSSARMREVFSLLEAVAASDAPVLVLGESGSGKELAARAVHNRSHRAPKPFIALNAGALSANLVESELFGHEKGAFTGADRRRAGAFERAHGGTLFLDEIGELPLELQAKLLRVLEVGELQRLGGTDTVKVDVRLVTATHRDLAAMVKAKEFREDLFFRLYVVPVRLPPLRERPEDIGPIVDHLLVSMAPSGRTINVSPAALTKLKGYSWPGNIRELKNTLQRAIIFAGKADPIGETHVVFTPLGTESSSSARNQLEESERDAILAALKRTNGNRREAAVVLGIARSTLFDKMKKYGLTEAAGDDD